MKRFFNFLLGRNPEPEPEPEIQPEPEPEPKEEDAIDDQKVEKPVTQKTGKKKKHAKVTKKKKSRHYENYHKRCMTSIYKDPQLSEKQRRKLPKLRQVELARPTQTSLFGEYPVIPIKLKKPASPGGSAPSSPEPCPEHTNKLAAPRQNWREIRRREIEERNKIYIVARSALRAIASARIIELAKPRTVRAKIIKYKKIKKRYVYEPPPLPKKKKPKPKVEEKKELVPKPSLLGIIEEIGAEALTAPEALTSEYARRKSYVLLPDFPFEGIQIKEDAVEEEEEARKKLSLAEIIADIDQEEFVPQSPVDAEFQRRRSYVMLPDFPFGGIESKEEEEEEPKAKRPSLADIIEQVDLEEFTPALPLNTLFVRRKSYVLLPDFPYEGFGQPEMEEGAITKDTDVDKEEDDVDEDKVLEEYLESAAESAVGEEKDTDIMESENTLGTSETGAPPDDEIKADITGAIEQDKSLALHPEPSIPLQDNEKVVEKDHPVMESSEKDVLQESEMVKDDVTTENISLISCPELTDVKEQELESNQNALVPENVFPEDEQNNHKVDSSTEEITIEPNLLQTDKSETSESDKSVLLEEHQDMSPDNDNHKTVAEHRLDVLADHVNKEVYGDSNIYKRHLSDDQRDTSQNSQMASKLSIMANDIQKKEEKKDDEEFDDSFCGFMWLYQ